MFVIQNYRYAIAIGSVRDYEGYQKQLEYGYKFKVNLCDNYCGVIIRKTKYELVGM